MSGRSRGVSVALPSKRMRSVILAASAIVTASLFAFAQSSQSEARQIVQEAVYNELHSSRGGHHYMYKDREVTRKGSTIKEVIETPEGSLSRTLAINDRQLTATERDKDAERLRKFANNPEARRKKQQSDREDDQRASALIRAFPDAFNYTFVGVEPGPAENQLVHLKFEPNPNFDPPNRETQVLVGMRGDMYIDKDAKRIAKVDGTLFRDVNFGWGILGKLDKGGRFLIEQRNIGDGRWETVQTTLKFTGKILMIKPLNIDSNETLSDFRPVPSQLTTARALELLQKDEEVVAENGGSVKSSGTTNPKRP